MSGQPPEILGLGVATVDDLFRIATLPRPNEKQPILSAGRQCGGLTASALTAAARLGCRCTYLCSLGEGELSSFLRSSLEREGITVHSRKDAPEAEPFHAVIMVDAEGERSVLWDSSKSLPPPSGSAEKELAVQAGCLFVDHVFAADILKLVRAASAAGVPVVGDFERTTPGSQELMLLTDHLIVPLKYARTLCGDGVSPAQAAGILAAQSGKVLACVTDGRSGAWYALGQAPEKVFHQPAFPMRTVVDSTGCGDVFHGVYAAGLVAGLPPAERMRRASAAAALKTQQAGAQAGAPRLGQLDDFLQTSGST